MKQMSFEILLNPMVPDEDALRLTRQGNKMYRLFAGRFRTGCKVSTMDLREICCMYQTRLHELRRALIKMGWCIDLIKKGPGGNNWYSLVRLGDSTFYAERKQKGLL
jgi:hypothetical protein